MLYIKFEPFGAVDSPNLYNYVLIEILLKKVRRRKCDPLGPVDRPDFHTYILIESLLYKVRHRKCDPLFVEDMYGPIPLIRPFAC